jgi:CDP-diglyceride synthetase
MKNWRRLHLYLGCLLALIFFAITGTWQLYRANDAAKDRSYTPPKIVRVLSAVHKDSHLPGKRASEYTPLRTFFSLAAVGLVLTTLLGVMMAFRFSRSAITPLLCLGAGFAIPVLILAIYR